MKQKLLLMEKTINEEIALYKELEDLYKEKQDILVYKKADELMEVDSKIFNKFESIKPLIDNRNELFFEFSADSDMSISKVIEEAKKVDIEQSKRFEKLKTEINSLVKTITELDAINLELTKFGIKLTNKTMQIILNNVSIPTNEYNCQGKVNNQEKLHLSSVSEEV